MDLEFKIMCPTSCVNCKVNTACFVDLPVMKCRSKMCICKHSKHHKEFMSSMLAKSNIMGDHPTMSKMWNTSVLA